MKRIHVHIAVEKITESIRFYSAIFGMSPTVEREDYAKWRLEDPAVNFAISRRGMESGLNHLGIEVDSDVELKLIAQRMNQARVEYAAEENAECCYARSDKYWTEDPQGVAWESFHTLEDIPIFGKRESNGKLSVCCESSQAPASSCGASCGAASGVDSSENSGDSACC